MLFIIIVWLYNVADIVVLSGDVVCCMGCVTLWLICMCLVVCVLSY